MESGKLTVTKPYGDSGTGKPYVAFTTPIVREGKTIGALSGAVALDGVKAIIQAIHPTPSSLAFVLGSDGQVISHVDDKFALKPATEVAPELARGAQGPGARRRRAGGDHAGRRREAGQGQAHSRHRLVSGGGAGQGRGHGGLTQVFNATLIALVVLTLAALAIASLITSRAFKRLCAVRDAMDTIGSGDGDMTHRLDVVGHDEVAQISKSFNAFVDKISTVMLDVRAGVGSMSTATSEIDMGNRDLSQRTETSAGSLEETSAALTQLTSSVKQTAETAEQATRLATEASTAAAERGGQVVSDAVHTMGAISQSSERITEIISVIDGIAFQTNILALNAAVEAARAGEQGRGFAVVAGEARTLAQRSAASAQEIKALIEASVQNVKSGTERVQAAGVTMTEIVQGIDRVQRLVTEIHGAMTEQSVGISQIDRSVSDMDQATQQNAALVEQSAAAAALLNDQGARAGRHRGALRCAAIRARRVRRWR